MIEHAGRDVDGVHGLAAPRKEGRIDAGARVEFQQPIGGLQEPQDVIVDFAPHPRQIDVIVAERIVLIGLARKSSGHAIEMIVRAGAGNVFMIEIARWAAPLLAGSAPQAGSARLDARRAPDDSTASAPRAT